MTEVRIDESGIHVGPRFVVSFHRTLRVPDDGGTYPLPPGLGQFAVTAVGDLAGERPPRWRDTDFIIPLYQREALWIGFDGADWKPNAVQVAIGGVDALTGEPFEATLHASPQNYLVCPEQPWLDGINAGAGWVRQFVAVPLGQGLTVESQLVEAPEEGALRLVVYEPVAGRFPNEPPDDEELEMAMHGAPLQEAALGIGAGGRLRQKIYPDPHGLGAWDAASATEVVVHLVDARAYTALTGRPAPPTPVDAATYTAYGLPWFALYDEARGDIAPAPSLAGVTPAERVGQPPRESGTAPSLDIPPGRIVTLGPRRRGHA